MHSMAVQLVPYMLFLTTAGPTATASDNTAPIPVFVAGKEDLVGVDNASTKYVQYREQNVVVTNNGTVVLVCQGRSKSRWSDRSGQDLVVKTSSNSGRTWSQGRLVVSHDHKSICPNAV